MSRCFSSLICFLLTLFSWTSLSANETSLQLLGPREGHPSSIVDGVSTITGDYSEVEVDLIVPGPDALNLSRLYSSGATNPTLRAGVSIGSVVGLSLEVLSHPRVQGSMQAFAGLAEASAGGLTTLGSGGFAAPVGWPVLEYGLDQFVTGMGTAITGKHRATLTEQLLQTTGMSSEWASFTNDGLTRMRVTVDGAYKGQNGVFEWIIESNGSVNHRIFIPNP